MKPVLVALGALAAVVLLVVVFFWVSRDDRGSGFVPPPLPHHPLRVDVDGGVRWRPHPDRAGLRYTPHP